MVNWLGTQTLTLGNLSKVSLGSESNEQQVK
jgi:hypothetical protein